LSGPVIEGALRTVGGPYFDDLAVGEVFRAPALTLTDGHGALHQAIVGDRMATALDRELGSAVFGTAGVPAHAGLVVDVAIGHSSVVTGRVKANLFYRGLQLHRTACLGDTLHTRTEVVGLRQNRLREDRPSTGLALLRIRTADQEGRKVLDFHRCAMLPLRDPEGTTDHADDLDDVAGDLDREALEAQVAGWNLEPLRTAVDGPYAADLEPGDRWSVEGGDVVSAAPELARLSLNLATVHHDRRAAGGERLVYGGHTIGLAATQAARCLPAMASIVAWRSCDHMNPVQEGDTLTSELSLEALDPLPAGGAVAELRSLVEAHREGESPMVLDWRFLAVLA
jgi:acyl dehydratase